MSHPIANLQAGLLAAFAQDAALIGLIGAEGVMDAPAKGRVPPYAVIARHDARPRDGDLAPLLEHRMVLHVWVEQASRASVLAIIERLLAVGLEAPLDTAVMRVTHRAHERTETLIDPDMGWARGALALRFHSEPA